MHDFGIMATAQFRQSMIASLACKANQRIFDCFLSPVSLITNAASLAFGRPAMFVVDLKQSGPCNWGS